MRSGDPHELSRGRRVLCNPTGGDGTGPNGRGFMALDESPDALAAWLAMASAVIFRR